MVSTQLNRDKLSLQLMDLPGFVPAVSGCRRRCALSPDSCKLAPLVASVDSYTERLPRCSLQGHTSINRQRCSLPRSDPANCTCANTVH